MRKSKQQETLSTREISLLIALAGTLDPDLYKTSETRALIYKAKSLTEELAVGNVNVAIVRS